MAVHTYTRKRDGAIVYCAMFYGPDGRRKVRKVRVVKADASALQHERAATAAKAKADSDRRAVENGEWNDPKGDAPHSMTFGQLVKRFLSMYRSRSGHVKYYEERSKVWLRHIPKDRPLKSLRTANIDRFMIDRRKDGVADETLRKDLCSLSKVFRWAVGRRLITENPADPERVKRPPKSRPDPHPLNEGEVVALLDACPEYLAPMIELAIETGADRADLLRLNWNRHIDRDRKLIILARAKTGVGRTLPYGQNTQIKRILAEAGKVRHQSGAVFLQPIHRVIDGQRRLIGHTPVTLDAAKSAMRRAWKASGITKPRPWKSLRATFATRKASSVDVPTIAALMGLTTAHVLDHYVKPSGTHLESAMADRRIGYDTRAHG